LPQRNLDNQPRPHHRDQFLRPWWTQRRQSWVNAVISDPVAGSARINNRFDSLAAVSVALLATVSVSANSVLEPQRQLVAVVVGQHESPERVVSTPCLMACSSRRY